ncbi:MAG: HAD family hydrolase [Chloroflexi bacterium]|nr:HAD family hydrolase [Chloroflexota bacterium]
MTEATTEATRSLNVYFDVDHTLVYTTKDASTLRPGAHEAMARLKDAGHSVYVWSAGGQLYSERTVKNHGLSEWVDGCFDKHPRVDPTPDLIIDDDWYLVEKYGGYCVSQYKEVDESDRELLEIVDKLAEREDL